MTIKQKAVYVWDYYRLHFLGAALAVAAVCALVNHIWINPPKPTFAGTVFYNTGITPAETENYDHAVNNRIPDSISESRSTVIETNTGNPAFDAAMQQKFIAVVMSGEADILIARESDLAMLATDGLSVGPAADISHNAFFKAAGLTTSGLSVCKVLTGSHPEGADIILKTAGIPEN